MPIDNRKIFETIYREKAWGDGVEIPLSGIGSAPELNKPYVNLVKEIIEKNDIRTVLDIGHGDWKIWSGYQFSGREYIGVDVVSSIAQEIKKSVGPLPIRFQVLDAVTEELPRADLVLCKDVLQHLSNAQVEIILAKINLFNYVIICNDIQVFSFNKALTLIRLILQFRTRISKIRNGISPFYFTRLNNSDIPTGSWRSIDLNRKPFRKHFINFSVIGKIRYLSSESGIIWKQVTVYRNSVH